MAVLYRLYKLVRTFSDGRTDTANNKWFARTVTLGTKDINSLAEDCSYSTTVTKADCKAVLEALCKVIKTDLQNSYSVRLDGLGIFRIGIKSTGVSKAEDFSVSNNVVGSHINFLPEYTVDVATGKRTVAALEGMKITETPKNAVGVDA